VKLGKGGPKRGIQIKQHRGGVWRYSGGPGPTCQYSVGGGGMRGNVVRVGEEEKKRPPADRREMFVVHQDHRVAFVGPGHKGGVSNGRNTTLTKKPYTHRINHLRLMPFSGGGKRAAWGKRGREEGKGDSKLKKALSSRWWGKVHPTLYWEAVGK